MFFFFFFFLFLSYILLSFLVFRVDQGIFFMFALELNFEKCPVFLMFFFFFFFFVFTIIFTSVSVSQGEPGHLVHDCIGLNF